MIFLSTRRHPGTTFINNTKVVRPIAFMRLYSVSVAKLPKTKCISSHQRNAKACFMEWKAKLRVPLPFVSDRSIHSDDNMMHPAENVLSMPAGNKFRKP